MDTYFKYFVFDRRKKRDSTLCERRVVADPGNDVLRCGPHLEAHRAWQEKGWDCNGQREDGGTENEPCEQSVFMESLCL